jgi:STE24 endopeptidase
MLLRRLALLLCVGLPLLMGGCSRETSAERAANSYAAQEIAAAAPNGNLPDYSLPPEKLAEARHLMTLETALHFGGLGWSILQLVLLLGFGAIAWMRDRAVRVSRWVWVQAYAFMFLLLLARALLNLPLGIYGHHISLAYGFSVQGWASWLADLGKGFVLSWLLYGFFAVLLFWLIGRAPRLWWLAFWGAAIPIVLAGAYLQPILIDPLFYKFEPLALHHPDLSAQLEPMGVPQSRQFLMRASEKVTTPNAYVTGFGPSKRVVVWDTSFGPKQSISPGTLWMVGHECGHYALNHVRDGLLMALGALPLVLYIAYRLQQMMLARFGARWRIPSQHDWAALAVLLLAVVLIDAVQEPISNGISRKIEHNADIYGQEAIHGIVANPQMAAKGELDADGLRALDDPNPGTFVEFWMFTHPAVGRRAAFAAAYDPWRPGYVPKYFPRQ